MLLTVTDGPVYNDIKGFKQTYNVLQNVLDMVLIYYEM